MIRVAIPHDIEKIVPIVEEAKRFMHQMGNFQWDEHYPYRAVFETDICNQHLFVYEIDAQIAGFIVLNYAQPQEYDALCWQTLENALVIHRMVVSSAFRGQGIATSLMQFAEKITADRLLAGIRTDTNSKNLPMLQLFRTLNYQFVGEISLRNKPDRFCCFEKLV